MTTEDELEKIKKVTDYIQSVMLDFFKKRVVPSATRKVDAFNDELRSFNWSSDEERLDGIASDFAKQYKKLELSLFDEFDKEVFEQIFVGESATRSEYSKFLREKIENVLNNTAAEPLMRIVEYVKSEPKK